MQKILNKNEKLIKTFLIFLIYFSYAKIITMVLTSIGIKNNILIYFFADLVFLGLIIIFYKKNLKNDFHNLKENYETSKLIKTILLWVFIIFVFNIVMGYLTDLVLPSSVGNEIDENTQVLKSLLSFSSIYTIFKTMFFATIAEELLFRESISDVIKNKVFFVIISAMIYTIINYIFNFQNFLWIDIFVYFIPAVILSLAYVKNNNNIVILILIKFVYQFIPLTILLLGLGA